MSAILIGIVAQYGLQGVFVASLAAGVIILLAGIFRLGKLVNFIPTSVVMGFTSGIAIIIALGQVDNFFGTHSVGTSALEKLWSYTSVGFPPTGRRSPSVCWWCCSWSLAKEAEREGAGVSAGDYSGDHRDQNRGFRFAGEGGGHPEKPDAGQPPEPRRGQPRHAPNLISPIVSIAMLGMIESLLCGASASRMKDEAFDADRELIAQGVGNILLPFSAACPQRRRLPARPSPSSPASRPA